MPQSPHGIAGKGDRMSKTELTKGEAYAVAEFIDMNIFTAIRSDEDSHDGRTEAVSVLRQ